MDFIYGAAWGVFITINFIQIRTAMRGRGRV